MTTISTNREVNLKEARKAIEVCFATKQPIMMWAGPGVGKSSIVKQITEDMGGKLYDVRLSMMEPTDLRGMPFFNKDSGKMEWAPPVDLPSKEDAANYPITILFLDELNGAVPSVAAACYQLILDRKVGTYELPDNCVIVAAGNRESDKGVVFRMPTPLANRMTHLEVKIDFDAWNEWAIGAKIHPHVVGYLNSMKKDLCDFDPKATGRAFASPRSWEFVSKFLYTKSPESVMMNLISGTIGEGLALKFAAHRKFAADLPRVEDVLSGKVKELKTKEISAHYSLITSLNYELTIMHEKIKSKDLEKKKWNEAADHYLRFCMDNFGAEIMVMGVRAAIQNHNLPFSPKDLKNFDAFYKSHGKLVLKAVSG